eukprot:TRINITY_DN19561_c0_g1_i1.p1 TRINITY_DN19561_c0_g1~~TRINITY_DN19561_c0_g1_i1.p1  ORF type:complete len:589 (+),score=87.78 TRINITY_DN19561_c0_g1_i1:42-1769(+)
MAADVDVDDRATLSSSERTDGRGPAALGFANGSSDVVSFLSVDEGSFVAAFELCRHGLVWNAGESCVAPLLSRIQASLLRQDAGASFLFARLDSDCDGFLQRRDVDRLALAFDATLTEEQKDAFFTYLRRARYKFHALQKYGIHHTSNFSPPLACASLADGEPTTQERGTVVGKRLNEMLEKPAEHDTENNAPSDPTSALPPWFVEERIAARHNTSGRRLAARHDRAMRLRTRTRRGRPEQSGHSKDASAGQQHPSANSAYSSSFADDGACSSNSSNSSSNSKEQSQTVQQDAAQPCQRQLDAMTATAVLYYDRAVSGGKLYSSRRFFRREWSSSACAILGPSPLEQERPQLDVCQLLDANHSLPGRRLVQSLPSKPEDGAEEALSSSACVDVDEIAARWMHEYGSKLVAAAASEPPASPRSDVTTELAFARNLHADEPRTAELRPGLIDVKATAVKSAAASSTKPAQAPAATPLQSESIVRKTQDLANTGAIMPNVGMAQPVGSTGTSVASSKAAATPKQPVSSPSAVRGDSAKGQYDEEDFESDGSFASESFDSASSSASRSSRSSGSGSSKS